jgi:hypothetical protein
MTIQTPDPAILEFVQQVIRLGSAYDMDGMERLYTPDQSLLFIDKQGDVVRSDRAAMLAEFRARRDAGEPPLSTEHRLLHVEQQDDQATVLLYRRMSPVAQAALYELRLRKDAGDLWQVAGETVLPWPNLAETGDFLPPRTNAA